MHSPFRTRGLIPTLTLALALAVTLPGLAAAKPEPGYQQRGFRLLAGAIGAMQINRVFCGLSSLGQICVNAAGSSTVGGANWPRGTADQYIFNTGLQVAGTISNPGGVWDGDTTGAFFFNPRGGGNGTQVRPIYNGSDPADVASWPEAAYVPTEASGDEGAALYSPLLQGQKQASQSDQWWVTWEGDPSQTAGGRPHPLGLVVETRGMGWNFPSGNEDIIYFIYTFYNITTTIRSDYVGIREPMVDILMEQATQFQAQNNAKFGITLPTGGYTITNAYAAFGTDMDIANANVNYASVNLPFGLGWTYVDDFAGESNWTFDAGIFGAPFFPGAGFAGVKYLKSPSGGSDIQLYSNTTNGTPFPGAFNDAQNTTQLWRYLSGNISTAAGDQNCNTGDPTVTHICWINNTSPTDMRFYQSSTELTLPPGGQGSIVVAYIFAAPVAIGTCAAAGCPTVKPGNPTILGDPTLMAAGVNRVDSLSGYAGFDNANNDSLVTQDEFIVVPGSLLGKSLTAQEVFNSNFLLPTAPEPPSFFTIPGDNQVTIFWQPSSSETTGDAYYDLVSDPTKALYNPNYRKFDVEGYRVYRGRVNNPAQLFLIAQFDYDNTVMNDYTGVINPVATCDPKLGVYTDCPVPYTPPVPGQPVTVANPNNIVSPFLQTKDDQRVLLANGDVLTTVLDSAVTGTASGKFPPLTNSGVPFVYVDNNVRNNFNYYYVVTAFDVNSYSSGPSSLESPKANPISVTPQKPASNYENASTLSTGIYGRNVLLNSGASAPALDPVTGRFAGPMPAANAWTVGFADFVQQVFEGEGNFSVRLDSIQLGNSYVNGFDPNTDSPVNYYFSAVSGALSTPLMIALYQSNTDGIAKGTASFVATNLDEKYAALYGGNSDYFLKGVVSLTLVGSYYSNVYGRGCTNGAAGFDVGGGCSYNGPRWFAGPSPQNNETMANPNFGNPVTFTDETVDTTLPDNAGWNNAGELPGVSVIFNPQSYNTIQTTWRQFEGVGSGAKRMADYNVYWGSGGKVDSVVDVTHNVKVPFDAFGVRDIDGDGTPEVDSVYSGGWGILNATNAPGSGLVASYDRRTELTIGDVGCVLPYRSDPRVGAVGGIMTCPGPAYFLTDSAIPGPTAFVTVSLGNSSVGARTAPVSTQQGFIMLLGGELYQFGMPSTTPPAEGTVWSARDYVGAITGGNGFGGDQGPYAFYEVPRPFTAVGAELRVNYSVVNQVNSVSNADLTKVHTVPDPYYVTSEYEVDWTSKQIKFVNLPDKATIRIYSASGVLVRVLNYNAADPGNDPTGGTMTWNVRNRSNQVVASGVYFYHVESGDARFIGRMTIINYAQ